MPNNEIPIVRKLESHLGKQDVSVHLLDDCRQAAAIIRELEESLRRLMPLLEAVRYTAGLGKSQMERVEKAKAALTNARKPL